MRRIVQLSFSPESVPEGVALLQAAGGGDSCRIIRRSVDARQRNLRINLSVEVLTDEESSPVPGLSAFPFRDVSKSDPVVVVGAGPAGLFAALTLVERGYRPVIFERGGDVSRRKEDVAQLQRSGIVDPESNYCFGEGGAGTFSDGKLYTRSKKRGDNRRVLELLVAHGADPAILYESHPHIGSDLLPGVIANLRRTILTHGGEIHFGSPVSDLLVHDGRVTGIRTRNGDSVEAKAVILACGHSARDVYRMLLGCGVAVENKGFAVGVRIEHPQALINRIQYHDYPRMDILPAAEYSLVAQIGGRGVYSFCMCPGGFIVPSATAPGEIVVNGMSPSRRNTPFANAGTVVELRKEDFADARAALAFQAELERTAFKYGGGGQVAPAQRMTDFVAGRLSRSLPECSYIPGLFPSTLHEWLPEQVGARLREGVRQFGQKMRGYFTEEAVLVGVESRTSSPVRVLRNPDTFESLSHKGLYPAGEGAGYAGGIVSSAVDGQRCAEAV